MRQIRIVDDATLTQDAPSVEPFRAASPTRVNVMGRPSPESPKTTGGSMRFTRIMALVALSALFAGCAARTFPTFTSPDLQGSDDQTVVTVLKNRSDCPFCVLLSLAASGCPFCVLSLARQGEDSTPRYERGRDGDVEAFRLPAGTYLVTYRHFNYPKPPVSRRDTVELRAGHTYEVKACLACGPLFRLLWIEDVDTGEVVAGPSRWCGSGNLAPSWNLPSRYWFLCDRP
jgi:hypothetical protein